MNILFLCQVLPFPLDAGPKIRAHYVLRELARDHAVTLVGFRRADDTSDAVEQLETWCAGVHTLPLDRARWHDALALGQSLINGRPLLILRDERRAMHALIARLCASRRFGSVHVDQLAMAQFGLAAPVGWRVLDAHNALWHVARSAADYEPARWRRMLLEREWRLLRAYEGATCRAFDHVVAVTDADRARFNEAGAKGNVEIIPICVDAAESQVVERRADAREVTYIGGMHWPPNAEGVRWLVHRVWPLVERAAPEARLNLVGKHPPSDVRAVQRSSLRVHGYVADPSAILARTAVSAVPLHYGGGMRVKILESWARGLPVVSTTIGSEGLAARNGDNIILADSPEGFAEAIVTLLRDPRRAAQLAASARSLVGAAYDWQRIYARFSDLHEATTVGSGVR